MTILWHPLRSDLSEQTEETFERFLLENAEDDLRAEILAHIKARKKAKDGKDCMLSDDLIDYVYSLDSDRYVKLMKRLAEIIEYEYDRFNNRKYIQKYKKPRTKRNWEE